MRDKDQVLLENLYLNVFESQSSVPYPTNLTDEEKANSFKNLSETEKNQLGTSNFVTMEQWPFVRKYMLERSLQSNPQTDPELTAYTPAETWNLFKNPIIQKWHSEIVDHIVSEKYDTIVFVPCAKTKPWENACRGIYKSYNQLRQEYGNLYFVTISEPLAIVPSDMWGNFPQYDNPGLFSDPVQRSGLMSSDWKKLFNVSSRLQTPFDPDLQKKCIELLGNIIKQFIIKNKENNPNLKLLSFVEDFRGKGTHSQMLDIANEIDKTLRFYKRESPREEPYEYIKKKI
jgi:hypothetical protein